MRGLERIYRKYYVRSNVHYRSFPFYILLHFFHIYPIENISLRSDVNF